MLEGAPSTTTTTTSERRASDQQRRNWRPWPNVRLRFPSSNDSPHVGAGGPTRVDARHHFGDVAGGRRTGPGRTHCRPDLPASTGVVLPQPVSRDRIPFRHRRFRSLRAVGCRHRGTGFVRQCRGRAEQRSVPTGTCRRRAVPVRCPRRISSGPLPGGADGLRRAPPASYRPSGCAGRR